MSARLSPEEAAALVRAAATGDRGSWDRLVDAYGALVWTVARSHRLDATDASDVSQTTWLRLVEHIDRLDEPGRVAAWLTTTARRESLRLIGRRRRLVLVDEFAGLEEPTWSTEPGVHAAVEREDNAVVVREALQSLPERQRTLMGLLMSDDAPSYEEISEQLDMPVGSIGPTRMRCIRKLREVLLDRGIDADLALSV